MRLGLPVLALVAAAALTALSAPRADARVDADSDYTKSQTFNGALRYLRIDQGYEITEKDPDAAYILFKYSAPGKRKDSSHGSVEVVETKRRVRLFVQLPDMPGYHETILRDGLLKRLRSDYGAPPPRAPKPPPPAQDAGAD